MNICFFQQKWWNVVGLPPENEDTWVVKPTINDETCWVDLYIIYIYIYTHTLYFQRIICNVWVFTKKTWNWVFNQQTYRIELVNKWINGMLRNVWEFSTWMAKLWTGTLKIWTWHGLPGEKKNNQKYEVPILKVVGPSMLIATDPKFQLDLQSRCGKWLRNHSYDFFSENICKHEIQNWGDWLWLCSTHRIPDTSD